MTWKQEKFRLHLATVDRELGIEYKQPGFFD